MTTATKTPDKKTQPKPLKGAAQGAEVVFEIPINEITPADDNDRRGKLKDIDGMAASIKAQGILQPLTVAPMAKGYMVVFGHRRLAGAKKAGLKLVRCLIAEELRDNPALVREKRLVENLQREDLSPVEEGCAFKQLIDEHGYSQRQLADKIGCSQSHIAKRVSIAELPEKVLDLLERDSGGITIGDAVELTRLKDEPSRVEAVVAAVTSGDYKGKGNPFRMAVEDEITKRTLDNAIELRTKEVRRKKVKVVDTPSLDVESLVRPLRGTGVREDIGSDSRGYFAVSISLEDHAGEECHAAAYERKVDGRVVDAYYVCTDVARHAPGGDSEILLDKLDLDKIVLPQHAKPELAADEDDEDGGQDQDGVETSASRDADAERKAAAARYEELVEKLRNHKQRRLDHLKQLFATKKVKPEEALIQLVNAWLDYISEDDWDAIGPIAEILGLEHKSLDNADFDDEDGPDPTATVKAYMTDIERAAHVAIACAADYREEFFPIGPVSLDENFQDRVRRNWFDFLKDHDYVLSAQEVSTYLTDEGDEE